MELVNREGNTQCMTWFASRGRDLIHSMAQPYVVDGM